MVVATHFVICNSPKAGFDKHKGVSTMNFVGGFKVGGFTNSMYSFTWCENGGHQALDQRKIRAESRTGGIPGLMQELQTKSSQAGWFFILGWAWWDPLSFCGSVIPDFSAKNNGISWWPSPQFMSICISSNFYWTTWWYMAWITRGISYWNSHKFTILHGNIYFKWGKWLENGWESTISMAIFNSYVTNY